MTPFPFLLFLPIFLLNFSGCGSAQVLGHSRREASELLRKGNTDFILQEKLPEDFSQAVSRLKQLELIDPAAAFYAGLLIGGNAQDPGQNTNPNAAPARSAKDMEVLLFCAALDSPSLPARQEAAGKLIPKILETGEDREVLDILGFLTSVNMTGKSEPALDTLRSACLYRLERHDEAANIFSPNHSGEWDRDLALLAAREASPEEITAISNKLASLPYPILLNNLRSLLPEEGIIFFRYPELLADLGRAYQYTPGMREEGAKLFRSWDSLFEANDDSSDDFLEIRTFIKTLDSEARNSRRFLLLYYSGRIERAREEYTASSESFRRALLFAPNALQSDACIWYMLMNAFAKDPAGSVSLILATMPQWNDVAYFADILDRVSTYLTGKRQWAALRAIFYGLENRSGRGASHAGPSLSQYAWILGRALEEGYIKAEASAEAQPGRGPEHFFRIAFEEGKGSYYYRAMAASKLGLTFIPETETPADGAGSSPAAGKNNEPDEEASFILGFFEYGAGSLVQPYIQKREANITLPGQRKIAEALAARGRWKESLDLVSRYTSREDYEISRQDLILFYPRPYRELIEKNAREMELGEEILYGLIRTESYFMSEIVSRSGAVGLAQLMEPTALEMAGRIARQGGPDYRGGLHLRDPEINIHIGSYYLRYLTNQLGSPMLALLAYNGGMGRVRRWLNTDRQQKDGGLPLDLFLETIEITETREYGRRLLAAAAVYGYLYYGMTMEAVAVDIYRN